MSIDVRVAQLERQNRRLKGGFWLCTLVLLAGGLGASWIFKARSDQIAQQSLHLQVAAQRERDDLVRLWAVQELEDLVAMADKLWPALPEMIPRYNAWMARAGKLVAALETHSDGVSQGRLGPFEQLRQQVLSQQVEWLELQNLERKAAWMMQARAVREGRAEPEMFKLDESRLPSIARFLNSRAWRLVRPGRAEFGREAEGLAVARLALTEAEDRSGVGGFLDWVRGKADDLSDHHHTLAWALFANGMDTQALAQAQAALAAAPENRKETYRRQLQRLAHAVEAARGKDGSEALAAVEAQLAALEAKVSARPSLHSGDGSDRRWHDRLTRLIANIQAFAHPTTGLIAGLSEEHGWGIVRRREFAASVAAHTLTGSEARRRWSEATASIADRRQCPAYDGLALSPQIGLLPMGRDPASGLWEFWHVQSGNEPLRGEDGKLVITEETGLVLVLLPEGNFWMGAQHLDPRSRNYEPQAQADESPVHEVSLSPYFLSKYEMTQRQWQRFTGSYPGTRYLGQQTGLTHPVEQVSWDDCMTLLPHLGLTLPTEAEWEYGARAGTQTPWWTGEEDASLRGAVLLVDLLSARDEADWADHEPRSELDYRYGVHTPVDSNLANPFGLYSVHGNVWEWCRDGHDLRFYRNGSAQNPFREPTGVRLRACRGGGFQDMAANLRSANRRGWKPAYRSIRVGVRPAKSVDP